MTKNLLSYIGSKRSDIKLFKDKIPKHKIDLCIEPFGGSGAVSFYLYQINPDMKTILYDNDQILINYYNEMKKDSNYIIDEVNKLINSKIDKETYYKMVQDYKKNKPIGKEGAILYLFLKKFHGLRLFVYPSPTRKINPIDKDKYKVYTDWIQKSEFICMDYNESFKKIFELKKSESTFIFLDPPYFSSFNSDYNCFKGDQTDENKKIIDNTEIYIDLIHYIKKCKNNMMYIINKNKITEYLYKKYISGEYEKTYSYTLKKTHHLILTNYK